MSYDLVIKNGTVIDGSGAPRYRADVAIAGRTHCGDRPRRRQGETDARRRRTRRDARASSTATRTWTRRCSGIRSVPVRAITA